MPGTLEEIFGFFKDPRNLASITPPWIGFEITFIDSEPIRADTRIEYSVGWMGLRLKWISRIHEWNPPRGFVDVQEKGPYVLWRHRHTLETAEDGVLMKDCVEYQIPFGPFGELLHAIMIRRQLHSVFVFRAQKIAERYTGNTVHFARPTPAS